MGKDPEVKELKTVSDFRTELHKMIDYLCDSLEKSEAGRQNMRGIISLLSTVVSDETLEGLKITRADLDQFNVVASERGEG